MTRTIRLFLISLLALLAMPVAAHAANVTVAGGAITFNAGPGETNTAVIVKQTTTAVATIYFVGDQNTAVTVTASAAQGCLPTPPALGLPKGYLCTVPNLTPINSLVENLGDGNDTGVINSGTGPAGTISGGTGDDTMVGGPENDTFRGREGTDSVAYVGISAAGISRTTPVTAVLPATGLSTGNGRAGENDSISADVEGLTGGNGNDNLTGNSGPNTIAGSAPPGTPSVDPQPAGTESRDTINGGGGDDSLLSGDSGTTNGGDGNDTIVGGRSFANVTTVNGGNGDDTLVSGLGSDNLIGGAGSNTLAYVSVSQAGLNLVNRGTGILVQLPEPGTTGTGGTIGGQEKDVIHDDIRTLIGSKNADFLIGSNIADQILGAAPVGTGSGVVDTPAGNDTIFGRGGDDSLVAGDRGSVGGGLGNDTIVGGRSAAASDRTVIHGNEGDDTIVSGPGNDEIFGDAGSNTLAYVSVQQQGLDIVNRGTSGVTAALPNPGLTATGGKTGGPEQDTIHDDIRTLIGSNNNDNLTGSNLADTIVGAAPVGTGSGVIDTPAGSDTITGGGGDDTLVGGDRGSIAGGTGNDSLVGGRSAAPSDLTVIHGNDGNDTIVSGLGNDEIFGDAGANTLAYASVQQQGLDIVDRGTNGVTATLPNTGLTTNGGKTGGPEKDIIHSDIGTLVGGNGNDFLVGNDQNNTIVGVAPAGTAGVKPGPAGNDTLVGAGGADLMLGAEGNDFEFGGDGNDTLVGGDGNDWLAGQLGTDVLSAGAGNDSNFAKDGIVDTITCGAGTDTLTADTFDVKPAGDCETISTG